MFDHAPHDSSAPLRPDSPRTRLFEALENRIMFDASSAMAELVAGAEPEITTTNHFDQPAIESTVDAADRALNQIDLAPRQLFVVDSSLAETAHFLNELSAIKNSEIVRIEAGLDGFQQLAGYVEGRAPFDSIHIFSHGESGRLLLGSADLNSATIDDLYSDELEKIGASIREDGDLLIYGCNFGEGKTGQDATRRLSNITGADVASSADLTGNSESGGDWELEVNSGNIEATTLKVTGFKGVMMVDAVDDTISVSEDSSVQFNPTDNDTFTPQGFLNSWTQPTCGDVELEFGEVGHAVVGSTGTTISLTRNYTNAIIFAFVTTDNDTQNALARVTDVKENSFDLAVVEPNSGAAIDPTDGVHGSETVTYLVVEAGSWELADGTRIEAGTLDYDRLAGNFASGTFNSPFSSNPAMLAQAQTDNNGFDFMKTVQRNVSTTGFQVSLERYESIGGSLGTDETIGYFAIEQGTGEASLNGLSFEADVTGNAVTDSDFSVSFTNDMTSAVNFLGNLTTYNGGNDAALGSHGVSSTGATIYIEEDQTNDTEVTHIAESASWLAFNGDGLLKATSGSNFAMNANHVNFTFTAAPDSNGTDSFTYTLNEQPDGSGASDTATVTLNIGAVADVVTDNISLNEDTTVSFNVLSNDNFEGPVSVTSVSGTSSGVLSFDALGNISFTPLADFNGIVSFTYEVTDSCGGMETGNVVITVAAVDDTIADSGTTAEDTPVTIDVSANDNFEAPSFVFSATDGANGTVVVNLDQTVTYTPDADFHGTDSFTYTTNDIHGNPEIQTVTVIVNPVSDVVDDTASTNEDVALTFNVLSNDNFEGAVSLTGVSGAANGSVSFDAAGNVTYTPDGDYNGSESLTYTVTDSAGNTETATLGITINPVSDIVDDNVSGSEDSVISFDPRANDTYSNSSSITSFTQGADGTVVLLGDGTFDYTPDADWFGSDSFTYSVTDAYGQIETATVTVTVVAEDDTVADVLTTNEDTPVTFNVFANDNFEGPVSLINVTGLSDGSISINGAGDITYTPDADFAGSETLTYIALNSHGQVETESIIITITPEDDTVADSAATNEDNPVSINVLANDNFEGPVTLTNVTGATNGAVSFNAAGDVTYTPDADYFGTETLTYTITEDNGTTETESLTITINPVSDINDDAATLVEDSTTAIDVLGNDTYSGIASVTSVTQGGFGTVSINGDGTLQYTPSDDWNGIDTFTYTVTDAHGQTETATVTVTISAEDDTVTDTVTTDEDNLVSFNVLANDNFEGAVSLTNVAGVANGAISFDASGNITYTPDADYFGTETLTYTITEDDGTTETETVTITVNPVSDIDDDSATTAEDVSIAIDVLANDTYGAAAAVTSVTQGANGSVSINGDGTVQYTSDPDWFGTDSFAYTVTDAHGQTETANVTVTVTAEDDTVADIIATNEDAPVTFNVFANDNFEGPVSLINVTGLSDGSLSINGAGDITYTPDADFAGSETLTYIALNSHGQVETESVIITITPEDDTVADSVTTDEDNPVSINVLANDNFEGPVALTNVTGATNGAVSFNAAGDVTYTPDADFFGTETLTYTVTEDNGTTETESLTITINAASDINDDTATLVEDSTTAIDVLANDTYSGVASVTSVTQGGFGTVSINGDGTLQYTPSDDWNGTDTFTYTVTDAHGQTETATVTVTISAEDDTVADTVTTDEDSPVSFNVLANDNFEGAVSLTNVTGVANGAISFDAAGNVTYIPDADYFGTETLTYTITEDDGTTETETVTITVNPVSDINDDSATTAEDVSIAIAVLANDTYSAAATVTSVTQGANGSVAINGDGTIQYTSDPDWFGTDSFTYTVTDAHGQTETANVTVTVTAEDDTVADVIATNEDTPVTLNVFANDNFEGPVSLVNVIGASNGSLSINASGDVTYTPDDDYFGLETLTYTALDSHGNSETNTISITINPEDDTAADSVTTNEDNPVSINVLANDNFEGPVTLTNVTGAANGAVSFNAAGDVTYTPDADFFGTETLTYTVTEDNGTTETETLTITINPVSDINDDTATLVEDSTIAIDVLGNDTYSGPASVISVTQGGFGTVSINGDGTIQYTPSDDWHGTDTFTYTVTDAHVQTETATVTVTISAEDDTVADTVTTDEDNPVSFNVLANDNFEGAVSLTNVTGVANGAVSFDAAGNITYTPDADYFGTETLTYTITEDDGTTETETVIITVNPVSDINDDSATTAEDVSIAIDVLANDTYSAAAAVTSVTQGANGSVAINGDGTIQYTSDPDWFGTDSFTYTVTDAHGQTETANVTVTVTAEDDTVADIIATNEDTATAFNVFANDNFEGPVSLINVTSASNGSLSINSSGDISYTPDEDYFGSETLTYTALDSHGNFETDTITITVNAVDDTLADAVTADEDNPVSINVLANDNFEGPVTLTNVTGATNGAVSFNAAGDVTYIPGADFFGTETLTYTVTEDNGTTETETLTITINPISDINNDTAALAEDATTAIDVLANDTYSGPASVTSVTQGGFGTVSINGDGTVQYTPSDDYNGTDTFTYTVTDAHGQTETATVTVTISAEDDTVADSFTTDEDTSASFNVLANDNFEGPVTLTSVIGAANGSVSFDAAGNITYTPDADYSGTETLTYTITEDDGTTETETISLTINPVSDIAPDTAFTIEDTSVAIVVLANDSYSAAATVTAVTQGVFGTVSINGDGTVQYTPSADWHGPDTFTYTVMDAYGQTETATVVITVAPEDDTNPDVISTDEDTPVSFNVFANDNFEGPASLINVTGTANGSLTINGAGDVTYTPDDDFFGTESLTYIVLEDDGTTETETITITVTPVSDINDDTTVTLEDVSIAIDVLANDTYSATATVTSVTQGANGTVSINGDGTLQYTPADDWNGTDSFTYTVTDAFGQTETATVTVNVTPEDDTNADSATTDEDNAVSFNVFSNDNFEGTVALTGVTGAANGAVVFDSAGNLTYTPDADYFGTETLTYTASEDDGTIETESITIVVNPVSDIADDIDATIEDVSTAIDVLLNDSYSGSTTISSVTQGSFSSVAVNGDGTIQFTPNDDWSGTDTFTYTVTDAHGQTETASVTVSITPVADVAPDFITTDEDVVVTFNVFTNDSFEGAVSLSNVSSPSNGSVTFDASGNIAFTPDADYFGTVTLTYTATEDDGTTETGSIQIVIAPVNDTQADSATTIEDIPLTIDVLANDSYSGPVTVTAVTQPSSATVSINPDNTLSFVPDSEFSGTQTFTYTVTDQFDDSETNTVVVTVVPQNDNPVATDDIATTPETTPVTVDVLGNDSDSDGDPLTITSASLLSGSGTVFVIGNQINYDPGLIYDSLAAGDSETIVVDYTISDGAGGSDSAQLTITVTGENDQPVANPDSGITDEDTAVSYDVIANDTDIDVPDTLTLANASIVSGSGTISLAGNRIQYDPSAHYNTLASGETATVVISYEVADSNGATDTETLTVTVQGRNDAPIASDVAAVTDEESAIGTNLLSATSDVDATDVLTITSIGGTAVTSGDTVTLASGATLTVLTGGNVIYDPNGVYDTLPQGGIALDSFDFTVSDSNGASATASMDITIVGLNEAPVANDDTVETTFGRPVTYNVLANDNDPNGDSLTVTIVTPPSSGTAVVNADGTITYPPPRTFTGSVSIEYRIDDGLGGSDTATLNIEVADTFAFDSFNNFSETESTSAPVFDAPAPATISREVFTLARDPLFSGYARPGTQIIGKIYDRTGNLVGEGRTFSDPGGNWLLRIPTANAHEFYRVEFEQQSAGAADVYAAFGLIPSGNSYQTMEMKPWTHYQQGSGIYDALNNLPHQTLRDAFEQNNNPLGFGT
ncbi:MAG: Ig-like domain-containing protein [Planctomycetota bacterium]